MYNIRKACKDDVESIYDIEKKCFSVPWSIESFNKDIELEFAYVAVAETADSGAIAGYAVIWRVSDELQLNRIAVSKEYRRQGIGASLLAHISETFSARAMLLEVREKSEDAVAFYNSLGFKATGIRKNYYGDDNAVLMEKIFNES